MSIGGHEKVNNNYDWFTDPAIIKKLDVFDLDPCSSNNRPWDTAKKHYIENGLQLPWFGRVWLNPPYGTQTEKWIKKLSQHGNGIALIFARTETKIFFPWVWEYADGILFIQGRLHFYNCNGKRAKGNAGAPSCLIAYGLENLEALYNSGIKGKVVKI